MVAAGVDPPGVQGLDACHVEVVAVSLGARPERPNHLYDALQAIGLLHA